MATTPKDNRYNRIGKSDMIDWHRNRCYTLESIKTAEVWKSFPNVKNRSVFIKPNLVVPPRKHDKHSTTNALVTEAVIRQCRDMGAREITVGCCGFRGRWEDTMKFSGYDEMCRRYEIVPLCVQEGENYHKYSVRRLHDYLSLYGTKISDFVLEADVVINLPKMKVHTLAGITGAIKNMMGVISPKGSMHPRASIPTLHKRLRDLYYLMQPIVDWTLMDGIVGVEYAEHFGVPVKSGALISGTDLWEVDCVAARFMGWDVEEIPYLRYIADDRRDGSEIPATPEFRLDFERPLYWRKRK